MPLIDLVKKANLVPGDILECGVYEAHSAIQILQNTVKIVWLVDSFEGLPEPTAEDIPVSAPCDRGAWKADYTKVQKSLSCYPHAELIKGMIPECLQQLKNRRFALTHLDLDYYQATKDALDFVVPRMNSGGIVLVHDFPWLPGIRKAVEESGLKGESNGEYFLWIK